MATSADMFYTKKCFIFAVQICVQDRKKNILFRKHLIPNAEYSTLNSNNFF